MLTAKFSHYQKIKYSQCPRFCQNRPFVDLKLLWIRKALLIKWLHSIFAPVDAKSCKSNWVQCQWVNYVVSLVATRDALWLCLQANALHNHFLQSWVCNLSGIYEHCVMYTYCVQCTCTIVLRFGCLSCNQWCAWSSFVSDNYKRNSINFISFSECRPSDGSNFLVMDTNCHMSLFINLLHCYFSLMFLHSVVSNGMSYHKTDSWLVVDWLVL